MTKEQLNPALSWNRRRYTILAFFIAKLPPCPSGKLRETAVFSPAFPEIKGAGDTQTVAGSGIEGRHLAGHN